MMLIPSIGIGLVLLAAMLLCLGNHYREQGRVGLELNLFLAGVSCAFVGFTVLALAEWVL